MHVKINCSLSYNVSSESILIITHSLSLEQTLVTPTLDTQAETPDRICRAGTKLNTRCLNKVMRWRLESGHMLHNIVAANSLRGTNWGLFSAHNAGGGGEQWIICLCIRLQLDALLGSIY